MQHASPAGRGSRCSLGFASHLLRQGPTARQLELRLIVAGAPRFGEEESLGRESRNVCVARRAVRNVRSFFDGGRVALCGTADGASAP